MKTSPILKCKKTIKNKNFFTIKIKYHINNEIIKGKITCEKMSNIIKVAFFITQFNALMEGNVMLI